MYEEKDQFADDTFRLVEQFNNGIFPLPRQFSDREIAVISGWAGDDEKGTFAAEGYAPGYKSMGHKIIDEYGLDPSAGENTWPKFAAILKARKEARAVAISSGEKKSLPKLVLKGRKKSTAAALAEIASEDFVAEHNRFFALTLLTLDDLNVYAEPFAAVHKLAYRGAHDNVTDAEILQTVRTAMQQIRAIDADNSF